MNKLNEKIKKCKYNLETFDDYYELAILGNKKLKEMLPYCKKKCKFRKDCENIGLIEEIIAKPKKGELKCPHCNIIDDKCNFSDLFYPDDETSDDEKEQLKLLEEMQKKGFNIVKCYMCGEVFIHRTGDK